MRGFIEQYSAKAEKADITLTLIIQEKLQDQSLDIVIS